MDTEKLLLVAAAAAVVFFPQIKAAFLSLKPVSPTEPAGSPSAPKSRPVGSERADWVVDLLSLQKVLEANGQGDAASLVSQAAVKIIGAPAGGGKK